MIFFSCQKEELSIGCKDPTAFNYEYNLDEHNESYCVYTKAIITVRNSNGSVIEGADVTLHQHGLISSGGYLSDLEKTIQTDEKGKAQFIYKFEAILNIEAIKYSGNDTLRGLNVIRLLPGETVTKVVDIN